MVIGSSSALFPVLVHGLLFDFVLVLNSLVCETENQIISKSTEKINNTKNKNKLYSGSVAMAESVHLASNSTYSHGPCSWCCT